MIKTMLTCALFDAKNIGFVEIYGVSTRTGEGIKPVRTTGRGSIFRDFVRTSFMDGSLTHLLPALHSTH